MLPSSTRTATGVRRADAGLIRARCARRTPQVGLTREHVALQAAFAQRHAQVRAAVFVRVGVVVEPDHDDSASVHDAREHLAAPEIVERCDFREGHHASSGITSTRSNASRPAWLTVSSGDSRLPLK